MGWVADTRELLSMIIIYRLKMLLPTLIQALSLAIMIAGAGLLFSAAATNIDFAPVLANIGAPTGIDPLGIGNQTTWLYYLIAGVLVWATGGWVRSLLLRIA